jgi:hypothetical protein
VSKPDFPHLPPGREPGAQSLRNRMGVPILWWFVGIVGTGMFLAGVFVAAGGRGSGFNRMEELFGGIFFGAMGLLCAWVAYSQYRAFRPSPLRRRVRGMNLTVDRDEGRRGEKILATLDHSQNAEGLEVGLVCVERYDLQATARPPKGGTVVVRQTNQSTAYEQWHPVEPAAGEQSFAFEIPCDAPYSYEGECISYAWRLSVRRTRKLRPDPRIDHLVWVSP